MQHIDRCARPALSRIIGMLGCACLALTALSCGDKKDGLIVEPSAELAEAGVAVRDWRRSGAQIDIRLYSKGQIPPNRWTLTFYDKQGQPLGPPGTFKGPGLRESDTKWIRFGTDNLDRTERIVIGLRPPDTEVVGP
jgi:hypothetical protein